MKKEIKNISSTRIEVVSFFEKNTIADKKQQVVSEICKEVTMPGFRKGKTPAKIVELKFAEQITNEINSKVIKDAIKDIEGDKEINVYKIVDIKLNNENEEIKCTLITDLDPKFELPDYKGFSFPSKEIKISEKEIDEAIEQVRCEHSKYEVVERAAKKGDFVKVSYIGKLEDGTEIAQAFPNLKMYGTQNGTWEEAGNIKSYGVHCVIENVIGMAKNDKKIAQTTFPEDLEAQDLSGKKVSYEIEVLEVRERILPEVNQDFLKSINVVDIETFRKNIKDNLTSKKEQENYLEIRDNAVQELKKHIDFDIPESSIDHEVTSMMRLFISQQKTRGVKLSDIQKEEKNIIASMREQAIINAKLGFILDKISYIEKIEVKNEDLEKILIQDSMAQRIRPEQLIKEIENDREAIIDMRTRIARGKALDVICKCANK